jgi:hypothetical protein
MPLIIAEIIAHFWDAEVSEEPVASIFMSKTEARYLF